MIEKIKAVLQQEAEAVLNIPVTGEFEKAIQVIEQQVHRKGGKLVASGMGKAGQIALNIATTFSSTGTPAVFLHPSDAQHGDLGVIQPNDVLLLISNSGKTREILELIELANQPGGFGPGKNFRRLPAYRQPERSLHTGADPQHLDHNDDRTRRHSSSIDDGTDRIFKRRICQTPPRRLPGRQVARTGTTREEALRGQTKTACLRPV